MSNITGMQELQSTFSRYLEYNHHDIEDILKHQGDNLAVDLFHLTRDYGPTPETIANESIVENWHIQRKKGMAVFTTETMQDKQGNLTSKSFHGKHRKSRSKKLVAFKKGELNRREAHVGFAASGWLSDYFREASGISRFPDGGQVNFQYDGKTATLTLINPIPGASLLNDEFNIVDTALLWRAGDMKDYIAKKVSDNLKKAGAT